MAKKAEAAPVQPAVKATRATGTSAASRFRALILTGKHTDDEIFATVAGEFNLDESKRSYVAWYRNDMLKSPEKYGVVPPAKTDGKVVAMKPSAKAPAPVAAPVAAARGRKPAAAAAVPQKPMGKTTAAPVVAVKGRTAKKSA